MDASTDTPNLGQRLAAARLRRGMSQATVARKAGVNASYISRLEHGRVQPTLRTALRVVHAIGAPIEEITGLETEAHGGAVCPVTRGGECLLDLIHSDAELERYADEESFTPRQVRLLRRFAGWVRGASPDRQRAMEVLLGDLARPPKPGNG